MSRPESDPHRLFRLITPLLLFFGVQLWLVLFHGYYGLSIQRHGLLVILVLSMIPQIHRPIAAVLDRVRQIRPRTILLLAAVIAVVATIYFPFTAWRQGRDFLPKWQDEFAYRIQFQQFAHGRLWYPAHPCADFFDTFQVLVRPVYASIYFPGTALLYTPTLMAHLPLWSMSSLIAGLTVAAVFLLVTRLIDPVAGLVSVTMLLGNTTFRKLSIMVLGYPLILLLTAASLCAWLHWRRKPSVGRAVVLGIFLGWAAITRPLDALIVAIPIILDVLLSLRQQPARKITAQFIAVLAAAGPFLLLQVVFNMGVTGSATLTPFEYYGQRDYPDTAFGFHAYDPSHRPLSVIAQKQKFHDVWTAPFIQQHTPDQVLHRWFPAGFKELFDYLLPNQLLIILVPLGFCGLISRRRVLVWLVLPLTMVLYSFYAFPLPHYAMIALPMVSLLVLFGAERVEGTWRRRARFWQVFLPASIVFLSLTETAELNRFMRDEFFSPSVYLTADTKLAALDHKPAIVLFRFPPDGNPHEEPVYNTDVPWPDDAPVIRAHDLGEKNIELFRYYADRQPQRAVYRFDRKDDSVAFLGFVKDLARDPVTR